MGEDSDGGGRQLSIICQGGGAVRQRDSYPCFRSKYISYSAGVKAGVGIGRGMP